MPGTRDEEPAPNLALQDPQQAAHRQAYRQIAFPKEKFTGKSCPPTPMPKLYNRSWIKDHITAITADLSA